MKPSITDQQSPTINITEAAALLRCGFETAKALIDTGELPALQLNQRHWVLLREDVLDFIRVRARKQAMARKEAHELKLARESAATAAPRKRGRKRRPLPDLDALERSLT